MKKKILKNLIFAILSTNITAIEQMAWPGWKLKRFYAKMLILYMHFVTVSKLYSIKSFDACKGCKVSHWRENTVNFAPRLRKYYRSQKLSKKKNIFIMSNSTLGYI